MLSGSNVLDKAQIEKSVLYPAFLFLGSKKRLEEEINDMNLLTNKIKPMYFKYLAAAFGSALISSVYGAVDMAMVGQYQGPEGTAALAVVAPVWNIIYSLGLLMGIGGSVLFTTLRGESEQNQKKSNEYFTAAVIGAAVLAALTWLAVVFFDVELLRLFGAEETLLPLARSYLLPIKFVVPSFLFTQLMSAFLRNDGNPALATKAVLFGGIFNVFGDYFFVFVLGMGITGAGLATAMGAVFSLLVMLTHFRSKKNTLRMVKPVRLFFILKSICITGFSTFFIDVAMGILTMLCLQHRPGVPADALCEFWRRKRETDCADFEICIRNGGGVWRGLDSTCYFCPQFLRPYFYDANGGNSGYCPGYYLQLRYFFPAASS